MGQEGTKAGLEVISKSDQIRALSLPSRSGSLFSPANWKFKLHQDLISLSSAQVRTGPFDINIFPSLVTPCLEPWTASAVVTA